MIQNGLLGKVVKTDNCHFIGFLYPDYPFVGYFVCNTDDWPGFIYTASKHLNGEEKKFITIFHSKEYLQKIGKPFISTYSADGKYDIDLTGIKGRYTILDLTYSKWGLDYKRYLDAGMLKALLSMDEQDFYDFVKYRWLSNKRCTEGFELYSSQAISKLLNKPLEGIYREVLSIKSDTALDNLAFALSSFITNSKIQNYNPNDKDDYNTMLKTFDYRTCGKEDTLAVLFSKFRKMNHNKKLKLIWLFAELQKQISTEV